MMYEATVTIERRDLRTLHDDLAAVTDLLERRRAERDAVRCAERLITENGATRT